MLRSTNTNSPGHPGATRVHWGGYWGGHWGGLPYYPVHPHRLPAAWMDEREVGAVDLQTACSTPVW